MISLPPAFDASLLFIDFWTAAAPFVDIGFLIGCGFLFTKMLSRY